MIFIPLIDDYDLTQSHIYELSNTRTNLIVFKNRLKSKYRLILKKVSDFILSLLIFPFLLPLMLYIAYRIKKDEPQQNILFKQKRLGQDGKSFVCYKFQTMVENSDALLQNYLKEHPEEEAYYDTYHKYKNDPRITQIGHILRRTSLDELPQIFNVFKGEMSFIGPRPLLTEYLPYYNDYEIRRHKVRPGLSGYSQVSNLNYPDWEEKYRVQMQFKGTGRALLSTIRELVKINPEEEYQSLQGTGLPVLLIWGQADQTIGHDQIEVLQQILSEMDVRIVEDAGHLVHYERPEEVNPELIDFLDRITK